MESAKNTVKGFLHKSGKNDTDVHENVVPAVKHENIEKQQREEVTTALDKEIHQDHYHTTVQPIADSEVLPEQHHHRAAAVEQREFDHGNTDETQRRLHAEASKFQNETTRSQGATTTGTGTTAAGQHTHHHVHETIQPVIEKRTIEPHVVHTTAPVHETHHNAAQHHSTSTMPTMSINEFERGGGTLSGRAERTDHFDGEPRLVDRLDAGETGSGKHHGVNHHSQTTGSNTTKGTTGGLNSSTTGTTGGFNSGSTRGTAGGLGATGTTGTTGGSTHNTTGTSTGTTRGLNDRTTGTTGGLNDRTTGTTGGLNDRTTGTTGGTTGKSEKSTLMSLMDKFNPRADADGDGKKGIMD